MTTTTFAQRKSFDELFTAHALSQLQKKPLSVENISFSDMASDILYTLGAFPKEALQNISDSNQTRVQHLLSNMPSDFNRLYDNLSSDQVESLTEVYASLKSSYGTIRGKWEPSTDTLSLGDLDGIEIIATPMTSYEDIVQHGDALGCPVATYASGAMAGDYFIWSIVASNPVEMSTPVGMLIMRFNGELVLEELIVNDDENAHNIKCIGMDLCKRLEDSTEIDVGEDWEADPVDNVEFISFIENSYQGEIDEEKDRLIFLTGFDLNNDGFAHYSYSQIVQIITKDVYEQFFKHQ